MRHFWLMVFGLILTFYSNYLYAIDKLLYKRKYFFFLLFNLAMFAIYYFVDVAVEQIVITLDGIPRHHHRSGLMQTMYFYNKIILMALGVGTAIALRYYKHLADIEKEREQLKTEKLTSEISMLKYQIQPHFLFNTLNNIYALVAKSPSDAQKAIHCLSKMMRYILYENTTDTIGLSKEIEFIENYNSLMLLRLSHCVDVKFDVPELNGDEQIPPLLLIPLIENAYKHGVLPEGNSFIHSKLTMDGTNVVFEVSNSMCAQPMEDRSHSGIGIQNLQKRLDIIYGDSASFTAAPSADGTSFDAKLTIPIIKNNGID